MHESVCMLHWITRKAVITMNCQQQRWPPLDSFTWLPDDVSRHATVKLDTMQQASRGQTPACLGQCKWGLISHLFDQPACKKHGIYGRISV